MPELPEVEVTAQSLAASLLNARLIDWRTSGKRLRHPMPKRAFDGLKNKVLLNVGRRAKYVLMEFDSGWLAVHLGMSGTLQVVAGTHQAQNHDHFILSFQAKEKCLNLVFNDPRRFGSCQFIARASLEKDIGCYLGLTAQGIEPLSDAFNGKVLASLARSVRAQVKPWLMAGKAVVGVGNIYACEALFRAGIHPMRLAGKVSSIRLARLAQEIQSVLREAIDAGGSSLRDFASADGTLGRYGGSHLVYDREGLGCVNCGSPIRRIVQAQRSTFYCHVCQK